MLNCLQTLLEARRSGLAATGADGTRSGSAAATAAAALHGCGSAGAAGGGGCSSGGGGRGSALNPPESVDVVALARALQEQYARNKQLTPTVQGELLATLGLLLELGGEVTLYMFVLRTKIISQRPQLTLTAQGELLATLGLLLKLGGEVRLEAS